MKKKYLFLILIVCTVLIALAALTMFGDVSLAQAAANLVWSG